MRFKVSIAASVFLLLVASARAEVTFTKVADQTTPIPAGSGTFTGFGPAACSHGRVLFAATGTGQQGLYSYENGVLDRIVDRHTPVPEAQGFFYEVGGPSLDGAHFAFGAYYSGYSRRGVFSSLGGLHAVVVTGTTVQTPHGERVITSVGAPSVVGNDVATSLNCGDYQAIVRCGPDGTSIVADTAPGSPFTNVIQPALGADFTTFLGYGALGDGVFRASGREITPVVLSGDPAPGWDGAFTSFTFLTARGDGIAFLAHSENRMDWRTGIYAYRQGSLALIADTATPAPVVGLPFEDFINYGCPSIDGGNVAFAAGGPGFAGLYVQYQGELLRILDTTDTFDGKPLRYVSLGQYGLSGDDLAFLAMFEDLSFGIYVAHIPEPSVATGMLATAGFLLLVRGRRVGGRCQPTRALGRKRCR